MRHLWTNPNIRLGSNGLVVCTATQLRLDQDEGTDRPQVRIGEVRDVLRHVAPDCHHQRALGQPAAHYIKCLQDRAIMPALQQRFIAEADAATPFNKTRVQELNACHTPQLSQPDAVANLLMRIAG